jgi:hypothetical protein
MSTRARVCATANATANSARRFAKPVRSRQTSMRVHAPRSASVASAARMAYMENGDYCNRWCGTNCILCDQQLGCTACKPGFFGSTCQRTCSPGCAAGAATDNASRTGTCSQSGVCFHGCASNSTWSALCDKPCSGRCVDQACDRNTGNCLSCMPDVFGSRCEIDCIRCAGRCDAGGCAGDCAPGFFGEHCDRSCGANCAQCNRQLGCTACATGFFGDNCDRSCVNCDNGG